MRGMNWSNPGSDSGKGDLGPWSSGNGLPAPNAGFTALWFFLTVAGDHLCVDEGDIPLISSIMRLIGFFCVLFSLFAAGSVSGQQSHGLIRGNVRNQDDLPLAGATAMLAGGGDTLSKVVDSRGAFSFAHLRNGRYEIEVSYIGLRTFRDSSLLLRSDRPVIDLPVVVLVATDRRALKAAVVARQRPLIEQKIDRTIV